MIYSPSHDSWLLAKAVKKYAKNMKVLDMGSGSGIQAQAAREAKAKSILASDINEEAVSRLKSLNINAIHSNLFSNIKGRFNLVIFNPPYLPKDKREDKESQLATSGGKKGDEIILKFLNQASSHLEKGGIILIVVSSLTPKPRILKILRSQNMKHEVLAKKSFFFETLEVWKIEIDLKT